jgi:hypothetical protein
MIIEDFVMLGRTVPELSKKFGRVVCSAGYSRELRQFLRIYPLSVFQNVPRWSICRLALRRNELDSRCESWRLKDDETLTITGTVRRQDEFDFLRVLAAKSIFDLNAQRASLGIVVPRLQRWRFDGMRVNEEFLLPLFPDERNEKKKPRIQFTDGDGEHDLQIRDWGAHEFLRKQKPALHGKLWSALKFDDTSYEHLFFVGNHNQHRTSWLVISIISERTKPQLAFDLDDPEIADA